ncbi:uncharacterized protein LOC105189381 [Harpegnathos saltator]|uniref:uncharacterized protein LOC105189381 n=1 Tax=Harpegnathos saltator TaxID=610380 RepID=UPI00094916BE|nr:uncharacterized protein LOC105189381 [Harpegnathos saltator]
MLVVNVILFISAVCSATNIVISSDTSVPSMMSTRLKRGIVDPGPDARNNQEHYRGAQGASSISSLQDMNSKLAPHYGTAEALDTQMLTHANQNQRSASHAYGSVPKRQFSPIQPTESYQNSPLASYFNLLNNPNTYKAATGVEKPADTSKSVASHSLEKLEDAYLPSYNAFHPHKSIELSGFSDFEYPSYSGISKIISQGLHNGAPTAAVQIPGDYPLPKATEYAHIYAASVLPTVSSATPLFQSSNKVKQTSEQKDKATVDANGKKVPIIQLQSAPGLSGVFPVFGSQPFLLNADYPIESDFGFNFGDMPKANVALQSKNASPFLSPLSSFQGQVVPIQTASSTPQFPQYKGASIEVYHVPNNVPKVQGSYESLYSQPQLHFGKEHAGQAVNPQPNVVPSSISSEDILDDAEIINKKNPEPHPVQPEDEEEEEGVKDMRYQNSEKEDESSAEEDDVEHVSGKYFKEPSTTESDFKPSINFPFKEYDETFRKHASQTDDEDSEDKPYSGNKNSSSGDDAEEEDSSSEYHVESPQLYRPYEVEDKEEEESQKYEKREEADEDSYEVKPKQSKSYGADFEREFEESYREELPKEEYVHVKEVPEIDSYNNPIPFKRQNDARGDVNVKQAEESKIQESRVFRKNRKIPKTVSRDNAAYGSDVSAKKASKVIYEEFYGQKYPKTGKYSKRAKTEPAVEKYLPAKKSTAHKEDSYLRAVKYYKFKSPKTDGLTSPKNKYPHLYSSASNWSPSKFSTAGTASVSNARQLADSADGARLYRPSAVNGQIRSITNAEILRDLTGI